MQMRIVLLTFLLFSLGFLQAQERYNVRNAKVSISGTSTIHDWVSTTDEMKASGDLIIQDDRLINVAALQVAIPVLSIKSGKGNPMDSKTYKALLAEEYPNITFTLTGINTVEAKGQETEIDASGLLSLAGQNQNIELKVMASVKAKGIIHFTGSKALKMSDFDIDPPTALFGTLKTGDEITISFDISMAKGNLKN